MSPRFRRFVDAQLQILAQRASDECAYLYAAVALSVARRGTYQIGGGVSRLAELLTEAIVKSGGTVRFDAPVLRLAYDSRGDAAGVTLLSGETIEASRAIISNLTAWDTYGKLVGLGRMPPAVRARLKECAAGARIFSTSMPTRRPSGACPRSAFWLSTDWQEGKQLDPEECLLMFSAAPAWDARAPEGRRAVTVSTFTDAEVGSRFHRDEEEHERQDQTTLETWWGRLHAALPELGSGVEVVETRRRARSTSGHAGGSAWSAEWDNPLTCSAPTP